MTRQSIRRLRKDLRRSEARQRRALHRMRDEILRAVIVLSPIEEMTDAEVLYRLRITPGASTETFAGGIHD